VEDSNLRAFVGRFVLLFVVLLAVTTAVKVSTVISRVDSALARVNQLADSVDALAVGNQKLGHDLDTLRDELAGAIGAAPGSPAGAASDK